MTDLTIPQARRKKRPGARYEEYVSMRPGRAVASTGGYASHIDLLSLSGSSYVLPPAPMHRGSATVILADKIASSDANLVLPAEDLTELVELLADAWITRTRFVSSLDAIFHDQAVELLIKIGKPAARFALQRLDDDVERWTYVLARVTGAQPLIATTTRDEAPSSGGIGPKRTAGPKQWLCRRRSFSGTSQG